MIHKITIAYLIIINCLAYLMMIIDKIKSKNKGERIPENKLLLMALLLGSLGVFLGMMAPVNHKSSKWKFKILVPLILILDIFLIYFMESHFS